jgi:hypothetical protein
MPQYQDDKYGTRIDRIMMYYHSLIKTIFVILKYMSPDDYFTNYIGFGKG